MGHHVDVRSGSFIVGNFADYVAGWNGTLESSKLYYVPLYPQSMPSLTVSAQALDGPQPKSPVLQFISFAYGDPTGDFFYATGTVLPHRGHWRLIATAGPNWGCFDLNL